MAQDFWDNLKQQALDGFKPAAARAEENIAKRRKEQNGESQLEKDMRESPEERAKRFRQGFLKRVGQD